MADTKQHSPNVWERLRENREKNTHLFTEVGIRPERAGKIVCPNCGAEENSLFWSAVARQGKTLHLLCPICEEARVRYSLAKNQAVDPVFHRGSVGGGLGVIAVLVAVSAAWYFRDSPPMQMLADDIRATSDAVSSRANRATGGLVGSGRYTAPSSSTSRSGSTGGASAGTGGSTRGGAVSRPATPGTASGTPQANAPAASARRNGYLVYVSRGDRRTDLDLYAARIIQRGAVREASMISVQYLPETDQTRVVVDSASVEWPRRLTWLRGWRRAEE
jgi:hypothetical protein